MNTPEDRKRQDLLRERFVRHLAQVTNDPPQCPICHTREWTIEPIFLQPLYTVDDAVGSDSMPRPTGGAMPVVPIVCKRCHFIYSFAWAPIRKATEPGNV